MIRLKLPILFARGEAAVSLHHSPFFSLNRYNMVFDLIGEAMTIIKLMGKDCNNPEGRREAAIKVNTAGARDGVRLQ